LERIGTITGDYQLPKHFISVNEISCITASSAVKHLNLDARKFRSIVLPKKMALVKSDYSIVTDVTPWELQISRYFLYIISGQFSFEKSWKVKLLFFLFYRVFLCQNNLFQHKQSKG